MCFSVRLNTSKYIFSPKSFTNLHGVIGILHWHLGVAHFYRRHSSAKQLGNARGSARPFVRALTAELYDLRP